MLKVHQISKSFGALKAVNEMSFTVEKGEIFGIAGPNGSGKSTLFNLLTGIPFRPDSGEVTFGGHKIQRFKPHEIARAGLARTFQRETSFETMSVLENIKLSCLHGGDRNNVDIADQELVGVLNFCGISDCQFHRPAGEISTFDKKRLMIATALAMHPKMLLLDEPASGLTKPEIEETRNLISKIRDRGITILLIEHVLALLLGVSDRLMVLNEGTVMTIGLPHEVVKDERVIQSYLGTRGQNA